VTCPSCGIENRADAKFCVKCGTALALACPACGSPHGPGDLFCAECGSPLAAQSGVVPANTQSSAPAAERRLVSVLFADLVGFTALSEARDSEDVRELLSSYFETCRQLIERYGGTVEKFIGDAVMAVWGTPVAQEDDAERAVRTALDLVAAIPEVDPALRARAGVLTGEAAVTLGATGEGMVAGDLVNTAARIQGVAEPGTVLVGEATRRATEAAIAYEDAGAHQLKGKEEPVATYRALRVTAGRGGALKSIGLEPPFVGRDRELRLVKELFHGSAEQRKAHLVSLVGIAGIGKSRLAWEFEKYVDGLVEEIWWHRGRCLAYGEGVAYWALAEMVRMRARIGEEEPAESSLVKLRACLELHVPDSEERAWLEPRLAHLLGLGEHGAADRQDLFSAWRLFFERLAEQGACVLVFEDLQWAEPGLLDFVEHLLEWSRSHALFVLALARPEISDRRGALASSSRNTTTLSLEPLAPAAMEDLLNGFAPGLPAELRSEILARAEGVPLYAVETVRMLLDRGLLAREGDTYRPTEPIGALEVPETLHALLAARLDGLTPEERALVQDASVLGKTFTKQGVAALSGRPEEEVEPILTGLIRKEVLTLQADPRSPERGQFGFLQDLLKRVAYETLSKKECKARHLAAAAHLATAWADEQEIVEVVASHYLDAYRLLPDADDAIEIKGKAREALTRAGERAASLAATVEAARVFSQAAELADDPLEEARLRDRAGRSAFSGGDMEAAGRELEHAHELFEAAGATREAARAQAMLGNIEWQVHQADRALERLQGAYAVLAEAEPDEGFAVVAAELARIQFFMGDFEAAQSTVDAALEAAERLWLPETISQGLNTAGLIIAGQGRWEQGYALIKRSLEIALENDRTAAALRAYNNLGDMLDRRDRYEEAMEVQQDGLMLARKVGARSSEWRLLGEMAFMLLWLGRHDEARAAVEHVPEHGQGLGPTYALPIWLAAIEGHAAEARRLFDTSPIGKDEEADEQDRVGYLVADALVSNAEGNHERALEAAMACAATRLTSTSKLGWEEALVAAHALGRDEVVRELVGRVDGMAPGELPPTLRAHAIRFRALLGEGPDQRFRTAAAAIREYGLVLPAAKVQTEHAEWLLREGRAEEAEQLLTEARDVFDRLGARPWLDRVDAALPALARVPAEAT
jgi:class 3 adenylate cyclase/tetratricopeptide (TPR) repeat protein